jgi:hypothetical protein
MDVRELGPGLWRWTAPHPAWTPGSNWEQNVGSVYYEPPGDLPDALVLIDPLAPPVGTPAADEFWQALDRDVNRAGVGVAVLIGNRFHGRSAREVYQRYSGRFGGSIHAHADTAPLLAFPPTHTFRGGEALPGGVEAYVVEGLVGPEIAFFLRPHRALVFSDALLGAPGGRVRVPPASWADTDAASQARYAATLRPSLRALLALDPRMLLVSHGEPIVEGGAAALAAALEAPEFGAD